MDTYDRQLRCFIRIAELGSISRASEVLDLTQSWISKQLAALEADLGKTLFLRNGRGVELTDAGEKLYDEIQHRYREIDRAVDSIREAHGVTQGTVRLAVVHTLSYYFLADVVASFVHAHPRANLSLLGRSSPEVVALVENGKAEIGFVYDSVLASDSLLSHSLFEDEMCLIVPDEADIGREGAIDLHGIKLHLVGFPAHYALRRMIQSSGLDADYVTEADTVDTMVKLVSSGVGACILPERIPDRLITEYKLRKVRIISPLMRRRVVAIRHRERRLSPLVDDLLRYATRVSEQLTPNHPLTKKE